MNPIASKNPNPSMPLIQVLPDRTAKAVAWAVMIAVCAVAHFEFMRLISPVAASLGF